MNNRWKTHGNQDLINEVKSIAIKGDMPTQLSDARDRDDLRALKAAGTEIWLDTGDRAAAAKLWAIQITGLTTNNTLANQVVQTGSMDKIISDAAKRLKKAFPRITEDELVIEVGFVVNARIARALVASFGAKVSVELHPALAYDTDATVLFAKRYFDISPENYYIKVPLTPEGLLAVRYLENKKIPVNLTLGFSARQNYLAAMLARPRFVNIFLGRLNQVVKENGMGDGEYVGEKATLASQAEITEVRKNNIAETRQIAASLRAAHQVLTLAGVDLHTIPPAVMEEFYQMKVPPNNIKANLKANLKIQVASGETAGSAGVEVLWEVNEKLRNMLKKLLKEDLDKMTGRGLVKFAKDNGVPDLFGNYSEADRLKIQDAGKIPKLSDWKNRKLALDDLMTVSALESFSKDQSALDGRIRKMIKNI